MKNSFIACRVSLALVAAAALSGCSTILDMRCETVSDRIAMHEGQVWRTDDIDVRIPTWDATGARFVPARGGIGGIAQAASYCPDRAKSWWRFTARAKSASGSPDLGDFLAMKSGKFSPQGRAAILASSDCHAPDRTAPPPGVPRNADAALDIYFRGKDIYLQPGRFEVLGTGKVFKMHVLNEGLNCGPRKDDAETWRCRSVSNENIDAAGDHLLKACLALPLAQPKPRKARNFVGTDGDRYCVFVSVFEEKPLQHFDISTRSVTGKDWISIDVKCADPGGDAGAGAVAGGSRPNSIDPSQVAE
jgi:hypothetical protein